MAKPRYRAGQIVGRMARQKPAPRFSRESGEKLAKAAATNKKTFAKLFYAKIDRPNSKALKLASNAQYMAERTLESARKGDTKGAQRDLRLTRRLAAESRLESELEMGQRALRAARAIKPAKPAKKPKKR